MKLYKSLLFGLLVCGMAACDTTDLERDINSLKDRVEDYEAQVQKLNDDMNIIRVLLDGNKTITSYSFDGANYTLTLSNGETLTLTQGVVGANYPSITIGENGNWVIAGTDSGVRAEAKDGEDAPYTPQFKIENENWCVSLDGGTTWENLGVKATGTASGTSPISSVTPATDGNSIKITLADGNTYTIPVVKDLVCEITEPELADGEVWYIGTGGATLKVRVNIQSGDIIRAIVPADWEAEIVTDYSGLSGEQTLEVKVTPPSGASKCVVTMEVNRGANTVTDEIVARTETTSYYADFMAGMEVQLGDYTLKKGQEIIINGESYGNLTVTHISSSSVSKEITADGVYFIDSNANAVYNQSGGGTKIIIGNSPSARSTLTLSKSITLGTEQSSLFCKNIEITLNDASGKIRMLTVNNPQKTVFFENCKFNITATGQPQFAYISDSKRTVENLIFDSCIFNMGIDYTLLGLGGNASRYNLTLKNNLFYSSATNIDAFKIMTVSNANTTGGAQSLILQNNTFYNVHSLASGMVNGYIEELTMSSNLFENSYAPSNHLVFLRRIANTSDLYQNQNDGKGLKGTIESNYGFVANSEREWQIQYGGTSPIEGADGIIKEVESLFESVDLSTGTFKVKEQYRGLGSDL